MSSPKGMHYRKNKHVRKVPHNDDNEKPYAVCVRMKVCRALFTLFAVIVCKDRVFTYEGGNVSNKAVNEVSWVTNRGHYTTFIKVDNNSSS